MSEKITQLNKHLGVQVLLESILYSYTCENYDEMKEANPIVANLCRKDIETLHRNHKFYISKFETLLNANLLTDFEELKGTIETFLNK